MRLRVLYTSRLIYIDDILDDCASGSKLNLPTSQIYMVNDDKGCSLGCLIAHRLTSYHKVETGKMYCSSTANKGDISRQTLVIRKKKRRNRIE